jgi:hypothetical protein
VAAAAWIPGSGDGGYPPPSSVQTKATMAYLFSSTGQPPLPRAPEHLRPATHPPNPSQIPARYTDPEPLHPLPPLPGVDLEQEASFPRIDAGRRGSFFPDAAEAAPCLASHGLEHSSDGPTPSQCAPLFLGGRTAATKETCVVAVPRRRRSTGCADERGRRAAAAPLMKKQNHGCRSLHVNAW